MCIKNDHCLDEFKRKASLWCVLNINKRLKTCLVNTPILVYPDLTKPFKLDTGALGSALVLYCAKAG